MICIANMLCEVCDNSFDYDIATDMTEKTCNASSYYIGYYHILFM